MLESQFSKNARRIRTENRDMPKAGWHKVSEGSRVLSEIARGSMIGHRIVEVRIAADKCSLWVKTEDAYAKPQPHLTSAANMRTKAYG